MSRWLRSRWTGPGIVAVYLLAVVLTRVVAPWESLPLLDGYQGPLPYHWVKPPPEFRAANQRPSAAHAVFSLGPDAPPQQQVFTRDTQLIVTLVTAGLPATSGATGVAVTITPLDPATLAPLPGHEVPDGNAYRVTMTYVPGGAPLQQLTRPGNIFVTYPTAATHLDYSPDGRSWRRVAAARIGKGLQRGAAFDRPGYYVAAPLILSKSGRGIGTGLLVEAGVGAVIFLPLIVLFVRRRHRGAANARRARRRYRGASGSRAARRARGGGRPRRG